MSSSKSVNHFENHTIDRTDFRNLRPQEAARYTGLSESTLAKLRMRDNRSKGPCFLKISGCIVYRRSDLDRWMDGHAIEPST